MKEAISYSQRVFLLSLFGIFCILTVTAQEKKGFVWPVQLQKTYTKTYPAGSETVVLKNRFGQMVIETWDKPEVTIDVHITVGAQTNDYAAKILDRITIVDEKKADSLSFITRLGEWSNDGDEEYKQGHEMRIDYLVHVPANTKLYAENSFGPMTLGDYSGGCELVEKYGTLTGGKLSNCKAVTVEFGKAVIASLNNSNMLFKYSKIDISRFAGVIKGQFEFCNSIDIPVDNSIQQLELKNNYTSLYLVTPQNFAADYDITTRNAYVTSKYTPLTEENKTNNGQVSYFNPNHHYNGSLGKGGGTRISIQSNFGNIRLM